MSALIYFMARRFMAGLVTSRKALQQWARSAKHAGAQLLVPIVLGLLANVGASWQAHAQSQACTDINSYWSGGRFYNPAPGTLVTDTPAYGELSVGETLNWTYSSTGTTNSNNFAQWVVTTTVDYILNFDNNTSGNATNVSGSHTISAADDPANGLYMQVQVSNQSGNFGNTLTATMTCTAASAAPTLSSASPNSGSTAGGTSVTLSGTNLSGATAVTFGGTAGSVTGSTATTVTVTSPAHAAGAVDVVVTAPGGSATLTNGFTYVTPAPTLSSASPNSGSTAGGTSVTLSGTNLSGATAVTFGGTAGSITGSTATTVTVTSPAHAAGAVDVVVTAPGGSATLTNGFTYVAAAPTLSSASPNSGSTAGGTSVTLSGTNLSGATAVTFGGAAGSVTGSTATTVTVTSPAHAAGAVDVVVTAPGGSATLTNGFTYVAVSLTLSPAAGALPGGTVAAAYNQTFTTTGGGGAYTYAVTAGALPAGLTLSPAGVLSGTPTAVGNASFSVTSTDGQANTGTAAYSLAVAGAPPIAQNLQAQLLAGTSITVPLTAGATGGPFTGAAISTPPPAAAGTAMITGGNGAYALVFTASAGAAGMVVVSYTLSNSWAASVPATISFTVLARPDPSRDPEVIGMLNAQAQSAQQLAGAQIRNFNDRLERLHGGTGRRENGFNIRLGIPQRPTSATDPSALADSALPENASGQGFGPFATREGSGSSLSAFPQQSEGQVRGYNSSSPPPAPFMPSQEPDDGGPMFWGGGFVNFGSNKNYELDISQTMIGVSGGIDLQMQENIIAGIGFGYGRSAADVGSAGTNIVSQAFSTALYGSYSAGKGVYLDALLGYSYLDFDSERYVTDTGALAGGTRDGSQVFGSVTASYEYAAGALLLSPYLRAEIAWSQLNGFTETGGGYYNLIYGEQTVFTLGTVLGLRTEYTIPVSWGVLVARGRLEYTHNFSSNSDAAMGYADLGNGLPYELVVDPLGGDYATVGLGLDARMENGVVLGIDYRGMTSFSGQDTGQTITVRVSTRF